MFASKHAFFSSQYFWVPAVLSYLSTLDSEEEIITYVFTYAVFYYGRKD